MSTPTPALFTCATPSGDDRRQGWLVPGTADTLAVDERWVDHWRVTHVPSGRAVMPPGAAELTTRSQAMGFARRFHAEAAKLGADLSSADWPAIQQRLFYERTVNEREEFWESVI